MEDSSGIVTVKCSNYCGFSVTGSEQFCQEMYDGHDHQEELGEYEDAKWYQIVFSGWGFFITSMIILGVVSLVNHTPIFK